MRNYIRSIILLFTALVISACSFEPADESPSTDETPVAEIQQALRGCGVDMRNSWATRANGGVWTTGWFENYGPSNCDIKWQFEVQNDGVTYYTAVYPLPSGWYTVAPGVTMKSTVFLSNIPAQGPCKFRTWTKMGSTWYVDSWLNCF